MICPNCGFSSAPGTMFCGSCGTRLASAPAQPNSYQAPTQPVGGYVPPQRPAYTPPPAAPAQPASNPYAAQASAPAPASTYQSYGSSMMQSPYITSAARSSSPVLSSSRDAATQYTAVSTNVYSPQAKAAVIANAQANKRKKAGSIITTVIALIILAATAAMLYMSGILEETDNSIYIPESSGSSQQDSSEPENDVPILSDTDTVSGSDPSDDNNASGSDINTEPENTPTDTPSNSIPAGLSKNDLTSVNAFISAFTEVGLINIDSSVSSNELMSFAVSSLSMNSNVYDAEEFSYGDKSYNYSISEDIVSDHISRYFGENVQIYPAVGDSGNGWLYYSGKYYFADVALSQGFAIVTDYSANGELVTVKFNVYASSDNDAAYYGMTANEAEDAGCTVIGTGSATLGKYVYNGRDTYLIQSIQTELN